MYFKTCNRKIIQSEGLNIRVSQKTRFLLYKKCFWVTLLDIHAVRGACRNFFGFSWDFVQPRLLFLIFSTQPKSLCHMSKLIKYEEEGEIGNAVATTTG